MPSSHLILCCPLLLLSQSLPASVFSNESTRGGGQEDLPHARGQGRWPGGATPRPRSGGCEGAGGPRGAIPRSRSRGATVRRHPLSKVKSRSSCEEIPHVQGKRNPSKTVGVARGHHRADTLKPYSQKTSHSNHTRTTALSNSMKR